MCFYSTTTPLGLWLAETKCVTLWKASAGIPSRIGQSILQEKHWAAELLWRSSFCAPGVPLWVWRYLILVTMTSTVCTHNALNLCLGIWFFYLNRSECGRFEATHLQVFWTWIWIWHTTQWSIQKQRRYNTFNLKGFCITKCTFHIWVFRRFYTQIICYKNRHLKKHLHLFVI